MTPRKRKEVDDSTYTGRFAIRLKSLREKKGLTVEQLAEKSGIPQTTLYKWESGVRTAGIDNLPILADALGVTPRTLIPK